MMNDASAKLSTTSHFSILPSQSQSTPSLFFVSVYKIISTRRRYDTIRYETTAAAAAEGWLILIVGKER